MLNKEDPALARRYKSKSTAEQNSVEIAWQMLLDPAFEDLRACMFATQDDLQRFRQLIVNAVIATDIFDPELKAMREKRWGIAFSDSAQDEDQQIFRNRATIVLEYIVQARYEQKIKQSRPQTTVAFCSLFLLRPQSTATVRLKAYHQQRS